MDKRAEGNKWGVGGGGGRQTFRNGIKWKGSRGEGARGEHAVSLCVRLPLAQSKLMHADIHRAKTRCIMQQCECFQRGINTNKQLEMSYNHDIILPAETV